MARVWVVSACLLGQRCRYDGEAANDEARSRLAILDDETIISVCPEVDGGLPSPRPAAECEGGDGHAVLDGRARVKTLEGIDFTAQFVRGAERAAVVAREHGATHACLKARSPSCGVGSTWSDRKLIGGDGVAAARLRREGLVVVDDEHLAGLLEHEGVR
jgi:uncharacterized protein YbbK (DUF523 family)